MNLLTLLFRTDVVVVTTPQTAIINNQSVVTMPLCTASRGHPLTGQGEAYARNAQVPEGYKGPVGKLVI
jgi:hypothetical protein